MQLLLTAVLVLVAMGAPASPSSGIGAEVSPHASVQEEPLDLNRATAEQLEEVPGIGPAMAARIVEWRRDHGPFEKVDDLLNIRGIGTKTLEKLRPYFTVGDDAARNG